MINLKILKEVGAKRYIAYRGMTPQMTVDFSSEAMEGQKTVGHLKSAERRELFTQNSTSHECTCPSGMKTK